eukprot:TRINITY_DN224_c0_g1_i1.p1 TRINITY_DN224_c0_g1~~TRINITY_DN224_c0_g1_i1.p1  ORF type:complete len:295 (+),score=42.84 TRINITY_DN224_c0_g1_i1:55-939(+)
MVRENVCRRSGRTVAEFVLRKHTVTLEDVFSELETVAIVSALAISMIVGLAFTADREEMEQADAFLLSVNHPNLTLADIASYKMALDLELPSATALRQVFISLVLSVLALAISLMLIISLKESGFRPDTEVSDEDIVNSQNEHKYSPNYIAQLKKSVHVHAWYSFNRWLIFSCLAMVCISLILLFFACSSYVNFKFPHYGRQELQDNLDKGNTEALTPYASASLAYQTASWSFIFFAVYILFGHFWTYSSAVQQGWLLDTDVLDRELEEYAQWRQTQNGARNGSRNQIHVQGFE